MLEGWALVEFWRGIAGAASTMMRTAHDESIRNNSFEIVKVLRKHFWLPIRH